MKNVLQLVSQTGFNAVVFFDRVEEIRLMDMIAIRYTSGAVVAYPYDGENFDNFDAIAKIIGTTKEALLPSRPNVDGK